MTVEGCACACGCSLAGLIERDDGSAVCDPCDMGIHENEREPA